MLKPPWPNPHRAAFERLCMMAVELNPGQLITREELLAQIDKAWTASRFHFDGAPLAA